MSVIVFLLVLFFISLLLALILTPVVKVIAQDLEIVDKPSERKMHRTPIPYCGGVAIYLSVFASLLIAAVIYPFSGHTLTGREMSVFFSLFLGGTLTMLVGLIDDIVNMPPKVKLLCQIVIVLIIVQFGVAVTFISNPFGAGIYYLPKWLSIVVTLVWIVGIMNALNLLDGLDGLLAGVTTISALIFLAVSLIKGQFLIAMVMASLAGAALGFLRYNFNPAQLFMGDAGSLLIGILFASCSVIGALKSTATLALFVPVLIMGLPIMDTLWAILRRAKNRQPIFKADKGHIHHRLMNLGLSQRQVVLIIYAINALLGILGLALFHYVK
ncbi:MAG: MraY family glycosyltransferase [Candidatus Eremiobacteraeota bacterium]|nr:MraY family glycosyltransferase [Candidatus Eremiobacteraeota bacterium]